MLKIGGTSLRNSLAIQLKPIDNVRMQFGVCQARIG